MPLGPEVNDSKRAERAKDFGSSAVTAFAVEVQGLKKTFRSGVLRRRRKEALRGLDLQVPKGAFWGILGPNGAGKTTFLSVLSNLVTPESGSVKVLGKEIPRQANEILHRINLSSGNANFLWSLTVRENLEYYGMLYGLPGPERGRRVDTLMEMFGLRDFAGVRFDELSTGTKQRLSLSKALINEPELLFLDEPTVGLDPDVAHRIRETIRGLHQEKGTTILMTTHNMMEAESLCEQIAFIKDGTIRAVGRPQELKRRLQLGDVIRIAFKGPLIPPALKDLEGTLSLQVEDGSCRVVVDDHRKRLPRILEAFFQEKTLIQDLTVQESDLEDVFMAFAK
jgi:ABC-2 type transport system ATP-binding protein